MFEDVKFAGRKVLITAGADGLGLEMARVFSAAGANVFVCDVNEARLADLRREIPAIHAEVADVSDEASVARLFERVQRTLGGLDVLINNAGIAGPTGPVETLSKTDWDRTLAVNVTGQFLCARLAIPLLKASSAGVMINLSSAAGHLGFAGRSVYSASKWAVIGFTKSLAIELGQFGIRVNAILPGAVEGPRIRAVIAAKAATLNQPVDEVAALYENQAALGRMVTARDIANMALFNASDAARSVSGQAIVVDGFTQKLY
ncbi:3-oxoacyl-[acyl-carrier-protein] reductase [Bordetella genomosp. 1]|uniref:3-oxoacyl-[acyl-carrier-protein] reductase n=1 Tax=Bordetella genomosp. 1 TaxID=1395607 RepID=A0A261SV26_9BORD|nr:SDR family oxidoreductase [Bordetella genomosp. 1]MDQ8031310.1 SDR family oxidoreductase [Bordetella sp.]OZI41005.1 3-oxoacyl-[acyl-carrier-protein] reductase [Bordetella genomosp. 1]OZI69197.1 3-oxoacyl-[acyl-carrier-protein] reductase [Bordetella genomosp. 1]